MAVKSLSCRECGQTYPLEALYACERCFGPLEVAYSAPDATAEELKQVYKDMGSSIGYRTKPREVTQWYVGAALLFALAAAGLSLLWTSRLV